MTVPVLSERRVLRNLVDASLDERRYTPEARDIARAMLFQMRGGRRAYVREVLRVSPPTAKRGMR